MTRKVVRDDQDVNMGRDVKVRNGFGATSPGTRMVPCWVVWRLYKPKSETKPIQGTLAEMSRIRNILDMMVRILEKRSKGLLVNSYLGQLDPWSTRYLIFRTLTRTPYCLAPRSTRSFINSHLY